MRLLCTESDTAVIDPRNKPSEEGADKTGCDTAAAYDAYVAYVAILFME